MLSYVIVLMCSGTVAEEDGDDMFKPPRLDDDDFSPFGGKSGLFSGGKGLFDDDDEVQKKKRLIVKLNSTSQKLFTDRIKFVFVLFLSHYAI